MRRWLLLVLVALVIVALGFVLTNDVWRSAILDGRGYIQEGARFRASVGAAY